MAAIMFVVHGNWVLFAEQAPAADVVADLFHASRAGLVHDGAFCGPVLQPWLSRCPDLS